LLAVQATTDELFNNKMASPSTINSQKLSSSKPTKHDSKMSKVHVQFDFTQIVSFWHKMCIGFWQESQKRNERCV